MGSLHIPEADVDRILKKPWVSDGLNFSDRIWRDKERLLNTLQGELTRGLIRGEPYGKIAQRIAGRMGVARSAAARLVETEAAFFSSRGQLDAFRDLGVEQYEFVATLDSRTSETCREMDGKVLPLSEFKPGITAPPLHCHCRSTTCPYFDDEFTEGETRAARDPETGKTVQVDSRLSYEEWKKRYVDKLSEQKEPDIMGKSHEKDVNPVHFVCKLDKSIYSVVSSDIQSGDVIITDERIGHIKDHHPNDYETFIGYIPQIIESPDYILASPKPHTAVVLKMIEENGEKFKVILRLRVEGDPAHYKHSIISFWRIGDTTWRKTLKNKVILYSRR